MSATSILITGGGGFVGSALAAGLAALGHRVVAADRAFDAAAAARSPNIVQVEGDIGRPLTRRLATHGPFDVIVHGAAHTGAPAALGFSHADYLSANLNPLLDMLDFAEAEQTRRFVFVSSSAVFSKEAAAPLNETALPDALNAYAAVKRAGETLVAGAPLEGVVVRLGNLYGPKERSRPQPSADQPRPPHARCRPHYRLHPGRHARRLPRLDLSA